MVELRAPAPERLLVPLAALGTMAALLIFRSADDNRLTSWSWVFADVHPARLYLVALAALAAASLAARALPARMPALAIAAAAYAVATLFWRAPEVVVDASRYFTQAKHLEVHGLRWFVAEWGRGIPAWTDLPLVPLLYGLALRLFGESRVVLQAFTTLLFAGTVALTERLGKALWDDEVELAGPFLLAMPYLLTQVPNVLVDVPTMFFFTLALVAVVEALRRGGGWRILLAGLAVACALLCKYSTWLLLSAVPVAAIARRGGARPLRTFAAIALVAGALAAAVVLPRRDVFSQQLALLASYQAPGLRRWGESFLSTFLFQIHPFVAASAVLSVAVAWRRRDARYVVVAWPVLLLLLLGVRRIRYLLPAFPLVALMAAYGLRAIRSTETRRLVVGCAVASSLVVALHGYLPFLEKVSAVNLARAGEYLDAIDEERAEVFTSSAADAEVNPAVAVPILDLFTRKEIVHRYGGAPAGALERARESPLRFTWEYRSPSYDSQPVTPGRAAVVVISDDPRRPLPEDVQRRLRGHRLARMFDAHDGVFEQRTVVSVYRESPSPEGFERWQAASR